MTEKDLMDFKLNYARSMQKTNIFFVFFLIFCIFAFGFLGIFLLSCKHLFGIVVLALNALFVWLTVVFVRQSIDGRRLIRTLESLDTSKTETKEIYCYKFDAMAKPINKYRAYLCGICVHTVHGKYYYLLDDKVAYSIYSSPIGELYSGEHEFEVYKDTNIIKSFPAADKLLNTLS